MSIDIIYLLKESTLRFFKMFYYFFYSTLCISPLICTFFPFTGVGFDLFLFSKFLGCFIKSYLCSDIFHIPASVSSPFYPSRSFTHPVWCHLSNLLLLLHFYSGKGRLVMDIQNMAYQVAVRLFTYHALKLGMVIQFEEPIKKGRDSPCSHY